VGSAASWVDRRVSAEIIPLNADVEAATWQSIDVVVPPQLPRIAPGDYEAVSVGLKKYECFKRLVLRLDFDVFKGPATNGEMLARLPYYMRWSGRKIAPTSKLGRLMQVAKLEPSRRDRPQNLSVLARKLWRVRVADAKKDSEGFELAGDNVYSVVTQVLERLA
jgi:hypothetical protein